MFVNGLFDSLHEAKVDHKDKSCSCRLNSVELGSDQPCWRKGEGIELMLAKINRTGGTQVPDGIIDVHKRHSAGLSQERLCEWWERGSEK